GLVVVRKDHAAVLSREYYRLRLTNDRRFVLRHHVLMVLASVAGGDAAHIITRFLIGRDLVVVFDDGILSGIVACKRKLKISFKHIEEKTQITRAAFDILRRIVYAIYSEAGGCGRYELHQPLSAFVGDGASAEARLLSYYFKYQARIDFMLAGRLLDDVVDILIARALHRSFR